MSRPTVARVELAALRHNYQLAKRRHGSKALAVVKANAYGHGAIACARVLAPEADGFAVADERLRASGNVADIVLMTHFARADEADCGATLEQIAAFRAATKGLGGEVSLSNSASVLAWPQARGDWARPGILLYGASPFAALE